MILNLQFEDEDGEGGIRRMKETYIDGSELVDRATLDAPASSTRSEMAAERSHLEARAGFGFPPLRLHMPMRQDQLQCPWSSPLALTSRSVLDALCPRSQEFDEITLMMELEFLLFLWRCLVFGRNGALQCSGSVTVLVLY